jgi:hypothetical protein
MPVLHPFLYGLLPVLTLLTGNIQAVRPAVAIRPAVICILLAGAMMALLRIRVREERRAALICSAGLLVFSWPRLRAPSCSANRWMRHALLLRVRDRAGGLSRLSLAGRPSSQPPPLSSP